MVGNCDPPKEHQFKPGVSGNPKGRPGGSSNIKDTLQQLMKVNMNEEDPFTGVIGSFTAGHLMYTNLMKAAAKGDLASVKEIFDRLEGKSVAKTEDVTEKSFVDNLKEAKEDET